MSRQTPIPLNRCDPHVRHWCAKVLREYKIGTITLEVARKRMLAIEASAYEVEATAEPDGEITYAVATTMEELNRVALEYEGKSSQ